MLVAALVLLAPVALLAIPLELTFRLSTDPSVRRQFALRWLFGLVRVDCSRPPATTDSADGRRKTRRRDAGGKRAYAALADPALRQRLLRFVADSWRAIGKRDLRLWMRIGLGDPADTGRLWALLGPLAGYLSSGQRTAVVIEPDFVDGGFEADGAGTLRLVPLRLLYLALGLLLSAPIRRTLWRARRPGRAAR